MYRISDAAAFFADIADCRFGDLSMNLQVNINDSFVPQNNGAFSLKFDKGHCVVEPNASLDAVLNIDIAEFSSLVMGCANLESLVKYGKATLSDNKHLNALARAFAVNEKPICLTYF